ncbi:hypothetical protein TRAPUB_2246 [Trametes pubescens]|uniref:Uncharacterized protein n=1 Tax=Trametes pubescens TaxID=154538 RepID=A0A1M2VH43_TRAPU|nr:hypothetical protein TRAPUB_2246 [Trametes pubescens]
MVDAGRAVPAKDGIRALASTLTQSTISLVRVRVPGHQDGLDGNGVEPEHGAEVVHHLACLGVQGLTEVAAISAVLLLGVVLWVTRPDDVEMGEAGASSGAIEREGREGPNIVVAGGYLLVGHNDNSDGGEDNCRGCVCCGDGRAGVSESVTV